MMTQNKNNFPYINITLKYTICPTFRARTSAPTWKWPLWAFPFPLGESSDSTYLPTLAELTAYSRELQRVTEGWHSLAGYFCSMTETSLCAQPIQITISICVHKCGSSSSPTGQLSPVHLSNPSQTFLIFCCQVCLHSQPAPPGQELFFLSMVAKLRKRVRYTVSMTSPLSLSPGQASGTSLFPAPDSRIPDKQEWSPSRWWAQEFTILNTKKKVSLRSSQPQY